MNTNSPLEAESTRKHVMIVDDEPDMLNMLKLVIQKACDCDITLATSGTKALDLCTTIRPDVIVTDIKMPDLDGLQLLKKFASKTNLSPLSL